MSQPDGTSGSLRPITEVARDLSIAPEHLELYGKDKAKVRPGGTGGGPGQAPGGQIDPGLGDHADAGRRRQDDDVDRAGAGLAADRRAGGARAAAAVDGAGLRPQGGRNRRWRRARSSRRTRSTCSSPAISTRSPRPTTCWPPRSTTGSISAISISTATRVLWKRVLDVNDRALRQIVIGLGGSSQGVPRESSFDITAASEVMAILCLADSRADLEGPARPHSGRLCDEAGRPCWRRRSA